MTLQPTPSDKVSTYNGHEFVAVNEFDNNEFVSTYRCRLCGQPVPWRARVRINQPWAIPPCMSWKARWRRLIDDV